MTSTTIVALIATGLGTGGLGALIAAVLTHLRETRRDRTSAIIQHADHLQQHLQHQDSEIERLWGALRSDAVLIRRMGDHIDILENHIWKGLPPPPPARPDGI